MDNWYHPPKIQFKFHWLEVSFLTACCFKPWPFLCLADLHTHLPTRVHMCSSLEPQLQASALHLPYPQCPVTGPPPMLPFSVEENSLHPAFKHPSPQWGVNPNTPSRASCHSQSITKASWFSSPVLLQPLGLFLSRHQFGPAPGPLRDLLSAPHPDCLLYDLLCSALIMFIFFNWKFYSIQHYVQNAHKS